MLSKWQQKVGVRLIFSLFPFVQLFSKKMREKQNSMLSK